MAKMQEKGRRLAQELPGFNWLEEKILNGGVTAVLTPRRLSGATCSRSNGGSSVDTSSIDMRAVPTSEGATVIPNRHVSNSALDAARSTSPTEYRSVHTYMLRAWWENNIKMNLTEIWCEDIDWIQLAQDKIQWQNFVNTMKNLRDFSWSTEQLSALDHGVL
jgi:hypothetical protein